MTDNSPTKYQKPCWEHFLIAALFLVTGMCHFIMPHVYLSIMPVYLPLAWHPPLVLLSGACEMLGGVGVLIPRWRRAAGVGLVLLLGAVFPANVQMLHNEMVYYAKWILEEREVSPVELSRHLNENILSYIKYQKPLESHRKLASLRTV